MEIDDIRKQLNIPFHKIKDLPKASFNNIKSDDIEIFVSPECFSKELYIYRKPMESVGICKVDESLALGEMIIKYRDHQTKMLMHSDGKTDIIEDSI